MNGYLHSTSLILTKASKVFWSHIWFYCMPMWMIGVSTCLINVCIQWCLEYAYHARLWTCMLGSQGDWRSHESSTPESFCCYLLHHCVTEIKTEILQKILNAFHSTYITKMCIFSNFFLFLHFFLFVLHFRSGKDWEEQTEEHTNIEFLELGDILLPPKS